MPSTSSSYRDTGAEHSPKRTNPEPAVLSVLFLWCTRPGGPGGTGIDRRITSAVGRHDWQGSRLAASPRNNDAHSSRLVPPCGPAQSRSPRGLMHVLWLLPQPRRDATTNSGGAGGWLREKNAGVDTGATVVGQWVEGKRINLDAHHGGFWRRVLSHQPR